LQQSLPRRERAERLQPKPRNDLGKMQNVKGHSVDPLTWTSQSQGPIQHRYEAELIYVNNATISEDFQNFGLGLSAFLLTANNYQCQVVDMNGFIS